MERIRFIDHKGQRILVLDFSGIRDSDEALRTIEQAKREVARHPLGSLRIATLVREARYNSATLQGLKELAASNAPYVRASAVVGMSPLHRIAYQAVMLFSRRKIPTFEQETDALDWLVQQDGAAH
jgi:hypothetical protein